MKRTAQDILNFVEDNDVKFAKLTFCDIFGNQKNVSLFASELPRAFAEVNWSTAMQAHGSSGTPAAGSKISAAVKQASDITTTP